MMHAGRMRTEAEEGSGREVVAPLPSPNENFGKLSPARFGSLA